MFNYRRKYLDSMVNYQQWIEMEEETKKLHQLVETQRDKINELVNMISELGLISLSSDYIHN